MALRLIRALPGERPLLSPLPRHHGAAWIDARVAAPGPHDFAVRCRVSPGAEAPDAASVHRNPHQRYVTNAFRPLIAARAGEGCNSVLRNCQEIIFGISIGDLLVIPARREAASPESIRRGGPIPKTGGRPFPT